MVTTLGQHSVGVAVVTTLGQHVEGRYGDNCGSTFGGDVEVTTLGQHVCGYVVVTTLGQHLLEMLWWQP